MPVDPTPAAASALASAIQLGQQTPAPGNPDGTRVWATVKAVVNGPPPTVTLLIAGSTTQTEGISYLSGYNPVIGDTVMCEYWGSDLVVYGTVATAAEPSTLELLYPVGEIYLSANLSTAAQVSARLGFGTWTAFGAGRFPVFAGTSDETYAAGSTGGASNTTLVEANMPAHNHPGSSANASGLSISSSATTNVTINDPGHGHLPDPGYGSFLDTNGGGGTAGLVTGGSGYNQSTATYNAQTGVTATASTSVSSSIGGSVTVTIASDGSGTQFSTVPPWIGIYAWKRTA